MKHYFCILGYWLLAEVLTLFLNLTLSFSGSALVRVIAAVCTLGILYGLMWQGGHSAGKSDRKAHREWDFLRAYSLSLSGIVPSAVLLAMLFVAKLRVLPDTFYRWYKILNAPCWPVCNLFSADVTASSMPRGELPVLLCLSLIPCIAVFWGYLMGFRGKSPEDGMYE